MLSPYMFQPFFRAIKQSMYNINPYPANVENMVSS